MFSFGSPVLLHMVSAEDRATLEKLGNRVSYDDGEIIHQRGDVGAAMGIVISGSVALYRTRADGRQVYVTSANAGQNFGDAISITGSNRTNQAVAAGLTTVDHYTQAALTRIWSTMPQVTLALYKVAAHRLAHFLEIFDDIRMLPAELQLAKMLRRMSQARTGEAVVPLQQEKLCQMLGLSAVSVATGLKSLSSQGLIKTGYRRITIIDVTEFDLWLALQDTE